MNPELFSSGKRSSPGLDSLCGKNMRKCRSYWSYLLLIVTDTNVSEIRISMRVISGLWLLTTAVVKHRV